MYTSMKFNSNDYIIKSNRESGNGRYDIMLIPHDKSKAGIVIEIKQIKVFFIFFNLFVVEPVPTPFVGTDSTKKKGIATLL